MMRKKALFASACVLALAFGCKKDTTSTVDCTGVTPTYTNDIKPIMDKYCATSGCHNATSKADGRDYSTYTATKSGSGSSAFLGSIKQQSGYDKMPQGGSKLSDANIKLIECWISNGTPQ